MGRCARRTKRIIRVIATSLTPIGVKLIGTIVGLVATTDWSNDAKREAAVDMARGAIKDAGIEAKETAVRTAIEVAVAALKDGQEALADIGTLDADDAQELEALG